MAKLLHLRNKWRDVVFAVIASLVVIADQFSKWWIIANLAPGESLIDTGFFRIVHVQNTGAAFGIFKGYSLLFTIIDFIGIIVFLWLALVLRHRWPFLDRMPVRSGIGLILGGTIGNLIDRLHLGQVTDFLDFRIWPTFNVADASITVGVILLAFCIIILAKSAGHRV
jgi:signal peptidase II